MTTPTRSVRIPEDLWLLLQARAVREHTSVSAQIVRILRRSLLGGRRAA